MDVLPVDLTQVVATTLGCLIALIPLLGIAVRFAAAPIAEALVATRGERARPEQMDALEARIEALERELSVGRAPAALPSPTPGSELFRAR